MLVRGLHVSGVALTLIDFHTYIYVSPVSDLHFSPQAPMKSNCLSLHHPFIATQNGGGGGFFLACEDLGRMFDNLFSACAFFFS